MNRREDTLKRENTFRRAAVIRRQRQTLQQRLVVTALTIFVILCGILIGSGIMAAGRSKASGENASFKYYTSIEIEQGDTLWSIASEYMSTEYASVQDYIEEVKELNQLGPDDIHAGQYLMIPYYSSEFH